MAAGRKQASKTTYFRVFLLSEQEVYIINYLIMSVLVLNCRHVGNIRGNTGLSYAIPFKTETRTIFAPV
jgi:hypothetical protein